MPNPLFGNQTSPNGATAPNDPLNNSQKKYARGYNKFNLSRVFYNTERYADINLVEVINGVEGDKLPFGNKHEIRSYTLKAPMMFDIFKKKTYFLVDNKAILPINWEKVYKQPNKGDDVNDNVNTVTNLLGNYYGYHRPDVPPGFNNLEANEDNYNYRWRYLLLMESIFSNGSLLASMNCHLAPTLRCFVDERLCSFDFWLESIFRSIEALEVQFPSMGSFASYFSDGVDDMRPEEGFTIVTRRQLLDMMRTYPDFVVSFSEDGSRVIDEAFNNISFIYDILEDADDSLLNLERLIAYQLVCTQFYTRDSVDNIYNSELFMQNAKDIAHRVYQDINPIQIARWPYFTYNGSRVDYDVFSGKVIDDVLRYFLSYQAGDPPSASTISYDGMLHAYYYLHMLFFYRKSLRFGDYFVGAKTLPYAPGDVTADVVGNGVSALDMTRSIMMQRFLNAVERASNTWKDYLKNVTDGIAPPNPLEPRFLATSTSKVGGFEVENTTSDNQGKIVSVLKSNNSNYVYEVEVGSPCIIIGVSTYEVPRVYSRTVDRFFHHRDRFDMFNKFMQNIGDQEVSLGERSANFAYRRIFGYQPRHMEYKQRYNIAAGGFVEYLDGYAFITDNIESGQSDTEFTEDALRISSSYVRNKNSELDRFYASLTGLTLASYFHFQVKYDCICHASRKMEYSPSIL